MVIKFQNENFDVIALDTLDFYDSEEFAAAVPEGFSGPYADDLPSCIDDAVNAYEFAEYDESQQEIIAAFMKMHGGTCEDVPAMAARALDNYEGYFESGAEYAESLLSDSGMFDGCNETVREFFDYAAYFNCVMKYDTREQDGFYFKAC